MAWGVWKALRRWWPIVNRSLSFMVGNGHRVKFWKDVWCGRYLCVSNFLLFLL